ncbi:MAG: OB-fold domain-containing protein [Jannaschia sp.]
MTDDTPPDRTFRAALADGRIRLQHCGTCDRHIFYPREICPHCHGSGLAWRDATGDGTIYTTTVVRRKPERGGDYNVCMVELSEGVRMMSRVDGIPPGDVSIGMAVTAHVGEIDGAPAILLTPKGT